MKTLKYAMKVTKFKIKAYSSRIRNY